MKGKTGEGEREGKKRGERFKFENTGSDAYL